MAQPTPYDRQANFSNEEALNPTGKTPGAALDAEFNSVKVSLDQTQANLALIQRDDGRLANGSVGQDQLAPSLSIGFTLRGVWTAPENYVAGDGVTYGNSFWRAVSSHTSSVSAPPAEDNPLWFFLYSVVDIVPVTVPDNSVTTPKLTSQAVTGAKIANETITGAKIAPEAITRGKLAPTAFATQAESEAGTLDDAIATPLGVSQFVAEKVAIDVIANPPGAGDGLVWDGAKYLPGPAGGGMFRGNAGTVGSRVGDIIRVNAQTLTADVTIAATENASASGPLAVNTGVTLTVASGGTLVIL